MRISKQNVSLIEYSKNYLECNMTWIRINQEKGKSNLKKLKAKTVIYSKTPIVIFYKLFYKFFKKITYFYKYNKLQVLTWK